jgi:hypothetical protein
MPTVGIKGRFGNQLFQYAFLKLYSLRNGLRIQVPAWQGEKLFGFSDGRPSVGTLLDLKIESFGREAFGDEDLALWERDELDRGAGLKAHAKAPSNQRFPKNLRPCLSQGICCA